jgi:hypothetical protein
MSGTWYICHMQNSGFAVALNIAPSTACPATDDAENRPLLRRPDQADMLKTVTVGPDLKKEPSIAMI